MTILENKLIITQEEKELIEKALMVNYAMPEVWIFWSSSL